MSERKNFRNATVVNTTAKKQSKNRSITEDQRVSDKGISVIFLGDFWSVGQFSWVPLYQI